MHSCLFTQTERQLYGKMDLREIPFCVEEAGRQWMDGRGAPGDER